MRNRYKDYFKNHYGSTFKEADIVQYRKWFHSQWKLITSKLFFNSDKTYLEIGSGFGGFYSFIKDTKGEYTGIELDNDIVSFANKFFTTSCFMYSSLEEYKIKSKYDFVFAFEVLEHLENPIFAIQKINSMIKKNGVFCGTTPYPYTKNVFADKTHLFVLHPENWKRLFMENGSSSVELYPMSFFPFLWRANASINVRLPFYISIPGFVSTCLIIARK